MDYTEKVRRALEAVGALLDPQLERMDRAFAVFVETFGFNFSEDWEIRDIVARWQDTIPFESGAQCMAEITPENRWLLCHSWFLDYLERAVPEPLQPEWWEHFTHAVAQLAVDRYLGHFP